MNKDKIEKGSFEWLFACLAVFVLAIVCAVACGLLVRALGDWLCTTASASEVSYTFTSQTYRLPVAVTRDTSTSAGDFTTALVDYNFVYTGTSAYVIFNGDSTALEPLTADTSEWVEQPFIGSAMYLETDNDYTLWLSSTSYNSVWQTGTLAVFEPGYSGRVSALTIKYSALPNTYDFHSGTEEWQEGVRVAWEVTLLFDVGSLSLTYYIPAPNFEVAPTDFTVTVPSEQYNAGYVAGVDNANLTVTTSSASYTKGYSVGRTDGYAAGYKDGSVQGGTAWYNYLAGVAQAPIDFLKQSLSFELLGVSMYDFVCSLLAVCGVVCVIKVVWR